MDPGQSLGRGAAAIARGLVRRWADTLRIAPPGWQVLDAELALWRGAGHRARFWWRDDDARSATPALDRLLDLARSLNLPLALAVIPAEVEAGLARKLETAPNALVLQHGWSHANLAPAGAPPAELSRNRSIAEVRDQLSEGNRVLRLLFSARLLPVLVPPFNRFSAHLAPAAVECGFRYLSGVGDFAGLPLPSRNVHADIIDWDKEQAQPPTKPIRALIAALRLRRLGLLRRDLPIGVMSHHLDQDAAAWSLLQELLARLSADPAVVFPAMEEVFA